jgi:hypothetical protein
VRRQPSRIRHKYRLLRKALKDRFSLDEQPAAARRQLAAMRQEGAEPLEEYADKVFYKAAEAYPELPEKTLHSMAIETFLRGCKDKQAAYAAAEKRVDNLFKAVKEVKVAAANLKVFGARSGMTAHLRQVSFMEPDRARQAVAAPPVESEPKWLGSLVEKLTQSLKAVVRDRSRSPSPAGETGRSNFNGRQPRSNSPVRKCTKCGGNHRADKCINEVMCYHCREMGHYARECPTRSQESSDNNQGRTSGSASN